MLTNESPGRYALFNTIARLFEGLSDLAKAILIILVADTLLGYHSEEGWTGERHRHRDTVTETCIYTER